LACACAVGLALAATPRTVRAAEVSDATVGFRITVPDEVPVIPELTEAIVRDFASQDRYAGAEFRANGKAFADGRLGIGLYVLWLTTQKPTANPADRIVDELEAKAKRPESKDARGDVKLDERLASTSVEYTSPRNGTRTLLRSMAFLDRDGKVHEITAECVLRDEGAGGAGAGGAGEGEGGPGAGGAGAGEGGPGANPARTICETALASLEVTIPEALRAPIGTPGPRAPEAAPAAAAPDAPGPTQAPAAAAPAPDSPLVVNRVVEDKPSRWPIYAGGGAVVLAIVIAMRQRKRKPKDS
jgi:hypothetical protein